MRTWSFVAQKGGVGKTTLALHLAVYAEQKDEVVAVIDIDPQTTALRWSKVRGGNEPMVFAGMHEKLGDIVGAARTLGVTLVIIDVPSKLDAPALAAINCADLIVTPTRGGLLNLDSLDATAELLLACGRLQSSIGVINAVEPSRAVATVGEAKAALSRLKFPICPVHVCQRSPFETCLNAGKGITERLPNNAGAEEIRKLWAYLNKIKTAERPLDQ